MVRSARRLQLDPTPEEIRRETALIRRGWSAHERQRRLCIKPLNWMPPLVPALDMPDGLNETEAA